MQMHATWFKILGSLASSTTKMRHVHFCRPLPGSEPTRECEANAWQTRDEPAESAFLMFFFRDLTLMPPLLQPGDPLDEDYNAKTTRAQYVVLSDALERFRKRWHNEYLLSLREKHYNQCAENPSHHLRVGQLVMVKHDNIHHIELPLGVITAVYPDERGVIRTAEVEECGRRSIHSVTFLVPLELDCHREDDVIQQRLSDDTSGNDDDNDDNTYNTRAQYVVLSDALERFRKRWHNEYLLSLREKHYNQCAENPSHHLRVGQLVMVKHDNIHHIELPLGVITAVYPDERGVIRTAEVEECGRRSIHSVTFLVPLELDCHREDDVIQQRLSDDTSGNDDDNDDNTYNPVDSTSEAGGLGSPTTTADTEERSIPHDVSLTESTSYRTPGSSRESSPTIGTTARCNITTEGEAGTPCTPSLPPSPTPSVELQPSASEGREREAGEPVTESRQPRQAVLRQRELLRSLIDDDLL